VKTVYWNRSGETHTRPERESGKVVETDAELRKHREQKGLETPVVYAVNDVHSF